MILNLTVVKDFIFLVFPVLILLPAFADDASAQDCDIEICKSAEDSGDTVFSFTGETPGGPLDFKLFGSGVSSCESFTILNSQLANVSESPVDGWELADIECPDAVGVDVSFTEDGVDLECLGRNLGSVTCTFINVRSERLIPTLSEWGMLAAAAGLGLIGVFFAVRRKRLQARA